MEVAQFELSHLQTEPPSPQKKKKVAKTPSARILNHCELLHAYLINDTLWINVE